jgi:uncharacterized protein YndB with AHSA1/START domain
MAWELKHSVITAADRQTVWAFYSNVNNWRRIEGDSTEFELDGPFQTGTRVTSRMRGQEPRHSTLVDVEPPARVVIQMDLNDAVLRFTWTFEGLPDRRTRLTQHIVLDGPGADAYVPIIDESFSANIEQGMERLAEEMARYGL